MSDPFVYTPQVNYHNSPYLGPITQQPPYSPFVPNISLQGSPYQTHVSLPPSPRLPSAGLPVATLVAFPGVANEPFQTGYPPDGWVRERRPSWHGGAAPATVQTTSWLSAPPQHQRRRSFGESAFPLQQPIGLDGFWPPSSPFGAFVPQPLSPAPSYVHPWLNGDSPRGDLIFDLSLPNFAPMRLMPNNQMVVLTLEELSQPATYPYITRMRIDCDLTPNWPVTLQFNPQYANGGAVAPPLTLGDVLNGIWTSLHTRISQYDYAALTPQREHDVNKAYTKRCKAMGSTELLMRNQGVKRVDFLMGKVWFRGLTRVGEGLEHMKMVVA